jgi:acyl carrier protein
METVGTVIAESSRVFQREVRARDDFFALGGDSLTAVELAVALSEALGVDVDPIAILDSENFEELAARLAGGIG